MSESFHRSIYYKESNYRRQGNAHWLTVLAVLKIRLRLLCSQVLNVMLLLPRGVCALSVDNENIVGWVRFLFCLFILSLPGHKYQESYCFSPGIIIIVVLIVHR